MRSARRTRTWLVTALAIGALIALNAGAAAAHDRSETSAMSEHVPAERLSDVPCEDGSAGPFTCDGIDLLSFIPYQEFVGLEPTAFPGVSDLWGWTDPETGDEYVIQGKSNGVAFFRVTDPTDPVYLGDLPSTSAAQLIWYDVKVFDNHAFIVTESIAQHMRVFDLTKLREATEPQTWFEDARYPLSMESHNIFVNEDTGFAYIVGGNAALVVSDQCNAGLHIVDVNEPQSPSFAGCWADDDYVHDTQCVIYEGPDAEHRGKELCFNSVEDAVTVVDVTDKSAPERISLLEYPETHYTHQGWLTEDQRYFVFNDELDEQEEERNTRTLIADMSDLDNPKLIGQHLHDTASIDHNLYIRDGLIYMSNYTAGLRVSDTSRLSQGSLNEIAFFDTYPPNDDATFHGTWSNYPFFESGTIAVSGIDEGLFLLRLQEPEQQAAPQPAPDEAAPAPAPAERNALPTTGGGAGVAAIVLAAGAGLVVARRRRPWA